MSKSGSRYGRRSNWFKIHCLLTQQQQQQQQQQHALSTASQKTTPTVPTTTSAGNNLGVGMVTQPTFGLSPYPALYAPRTKEELMMLGLEVYKHAAPSPSVSSPDSHNSDNSGVDVRLPNTLNPLAQQMRKDLSPFLQLPHFPTLMPPPSFLPPPSPLLFPSYHSVLYQQQQQQQQQQQTFVRHLIRATPAQRLAAGGTEPTETLKADTLNNNHLPNGSKMAEELSKCFYLEAMIKSQQQTTNNGQTAAADTELEHEERQPQIEEEEEEEEAEAEADKPATPDNSIEDQEKQQSSPNKQLILSMTPPRSPTIKLELKRHIDQDNPIDLSLKVCSSVSSKCSLSDDSDHDAHESESINSKDLNDEQKEDVIKLAKKSKKRATNKIFMPPSKRLRPQQEEQEVKDAKTTDAEDVINAAKQELKCESETVTQQVTKLNTKPLDLTTKL